MVKNAPPTEILIIDVEATCDRIRRPDQKSDIIQIGLCMYDAKSRGFEGEQRFVRPERSDVTPFCTELTGITPDVLLNSTSFFDACEWLRHDWKSETRIWASYGDYDREQFIRQCREMGIAYPFGKRHLNLKSVVAMFQGWNREVGMAEALQRLDLPLHGRHHDAMDDATNITLLWDHILHGARKKVTA